MGFFWRPRKAPKLQRDFRISEQNIGAILAKWIIRIPRVTIPRNMQREDINLGFAYMALLFIHTGVESIEAQYTDRPEKNFYSKHISRNETIRLETNSRSRK